MCFSVYHSVISCVFCFTSHCCNTSRKITLFFVSVEDFMYVVIYLIIAIYCMLVCFNFSMYLFIEVYLFLNC